MCTQKPPHDYSEHLYNKYREAFTTYISNQVCPIGPLLAVFHSGQSSISTWPDVCCGSMSLDDLHHITACR